MSVGLLLITHGNVGQCVLDTAVAVLGSCPLPSQAMAIPMGCEREIMRCKASETIAQLQQGDGVLVLTDMYGATPCNIACDLKSDQVAVVSGLNLPMLIRVLNYPTLSLPEMVEKAISGGRDGVVLCHWGQTT